MDRHIIWAAILLHSICGIVLCNTLEENWIQPNAWGRDSVNDKVDSAEDSQCGKCSWRTVSSAGPYGNAVNEDTLSLLYYKKFIANLFSREKLLHDVVSRQYKRALVFHLNQDQLDKLEQLTDPRDLDIVLTEIFNNARTPYKYNEGGPYVENPSIFMLVLDILKDLAQILKHSNVQFGLIVLTAILTGWFFHRRYRIGIVTLFIGSLIFFGYFITYLECNKKLEMERMLEALQQNERGGDMANEGWFTNIFAFFHKSAGTDLDKRKLHAKIKHSSKIHFPYCRPDHVFMLYANELLLKQLEFLIDKCTETFTSIKDKFGFPYNIVAGLGLVALIAYIMNLFFKYILSPRAWASLLHRPQAAQQEHSAISGGVHLTPTAEDRISGDNLKLLLHAITKAPVNVNNTTTLAVSGVQEIVEQIEAPASSHSSSSSSSASTTPSHSVSSSVNTSLEQSTTTAIRANNNSYDKDVDNITKVSLEDLPGDIKA